MKKTAEVTNTNKDNNNTHDMKTNSSSYFEMTCLSEIYKSSPMR